MWIRSPHIQISSKLSVTEAAESWSVFHHYFSSITVKAAALQVIQDWTHCWCQGLNQQLFVLSDILSNTGSHARVDRKKSKTCLRKFGVEIKKKKDIR